VNSLRSRLLLAMTIILTAFLSISGYALFHSFSDSVQAATQDRLRGQVFSLIAVAELNTGIVQLSSRLPDARLNQEDSGLYAIITDSNNQIAWTSPSVTERIQVSLEKMRATELIFKRIRLKSKEDLFYLAFGVPWDDNQRQVTYSFHIFETLENYNKEIFRFQQHLVGWLGGAAVVLLILFNFLQQWSMRPLQNAGEELKLIEQGKQDYLGAHYPKEIERLTDDINLLIRSRQSRISRYKNALADLAHSLKTPLALIRSTIETNTTPQPSNQIINEQIDRMNQIVDYQLKRAATTGQSALALPIDIEKTTNKIIRSLCTVYQERGIQIEAEVDQHLFFTGDEGDYMELLGNVLDNAFKWTRHHIQLRVQASNQESGIFIQIDDNGPGLEPSMQERITQRGVTDPSEAGGHGIGLAVAKDIVASYSGKIVFRHSKLGGLCVRIWLYN